MKKFLFIIFIILALIIGVYPLLYVFVEQKYTFLNSKIPGVLHNPVWKISFISHISFGGLSLLIGWRQFGSKFRNKNLVLHRMIGKIYVFSAIISSLSGIYLGIFANGGIISSLGFIFLGIIWFVTTVSALLHIRKGNIQKHRFLMTYSYACTFAAVTLRLWYPLLKSISGDPSTSYIIVAWLCWIPNIAVAYFVNKNSSVY